MPLEVIGAGFGRTGTLSLKNALERLGYSKCYHMVELSENPEHRPAWWAAARGDSVEWDELFRGYLAAVDWPACTYWRTYRELYPEAKVVLTTRDSEGWYRSVTRTIYPASTSNRDSKDPERLDRAAWIDAVVWDGTFGGRFEDKSHAIEVYERHNAAVRADVPTELLLEIEPGAGWRPLCEFLGCEVPDESYPQVNSTADFRARVASAANTSGSLD